MNPVSRGFKNAFRNLIRTISLVFILGLSIGLCLVMLIAQKAVNNKINSVKSSIGNTVIISPAGFSSGSQVNNDLTTTQLTKIQSLPHIVALAESLTARLKNVNSPSLNRAASQNQSTATTSLSSPITINAKRGRFFNQGGASTLPTNFSLPISFIGTTAPLNLGHSTIAVSSGQSINGNGSSTQALISNAMASKNNLHLGSSFSAYNNNLTVAGIFNSQNKGIQNSVVLPLATLERLSGNPGAVTSATATVDSIDNLTTSTNKIQQTLGSNADVVSAIQQATNAIAPLNSVKSVATFSLIGALIAGSIIILLTMVMVVRERRQEIGVLKAIGATNIRISSEFIIESLTLAILGAMIGLIIGVIGGQPVTKMLVSGSNPQSSTSQIKGRSGGGQAGRKHTPKSFRAELSNVRTQIGWQVLAEGFGAAVFISLVGSSLSAAMISKVRPSTAMRSV